MLATDRRHMVMRSLALVLGALLVSVATASAQFAMPAPVAAGEDFSVEVAVMLWRPTPELRVQAGPEAPDGDLTPDLAQVFGLERHRSTEFRLALKPAARHRFRFSYLPVHYEQAVVAEADVVIGDATFAAGAPAEVDMRWTQWRLGYQYDLASTPRALLGVILEVRRNRLESAITSAEAAHAMDEQVTVPSVGLITRGYLHQSVSLTAEFAGFAVPGRIGRWITDDDIDVTMRDLDLYVTGNLSRHLGLQGGYRRLRTEFLVEQHRGDLKTSGWHIGAAVRF
jgi:hypothetical protein